ncbi:MAG TPA: ubiquitin-like domain-containing protein [Anaerolineae bacterium]|nr:ubiquitin-like domain-containing protein [Anaerolineae bacterium]
MELEQHPWVKRRSARSGSAAGPGAILAIGALLGIFGVMAAGYAGRLNAVTLVIDGQPRSVRTNQTTVEGVLRDAGLALDPADRVQPGPDAELASNSIIQIERARPVTLLVDGRTLRLRTHAATLVDLFAEQKIEVGPSDALFIDGDAAAIGSGFTTAPATPHTVTIRRAVPLTVSFDDGTARTLLTTQPTIGQALNEAGIETYLADHLTPNASARVTAGSTVFVDRSMPVTVQLDGRSIHTRTQRERVGDVLAELGVALQGEDYTQPPLDGPVQPDLTVRVVRVSETFLIEQEPVAFETQVLPNADLEIDVQQLVQEGESGVLQKRIRVRYEDGQEVGRLIEDQTLVRAPRPKIVNYGTQISVRTIDTPNGPREYWRHFRALATSYSAATAGVPRSNPHYGRTALGLPMRKGIVAVDPAIIPMRSEMFVPGYGVGMAGDTGGAIIGKHIDLGYDDDNLVIWYRWVDVYLLTPIPPANQIQYTLPNWPVERR